MRLREAELGAQQGQSQRGSEGSEGAGEQGQEAAPEVCHKGGQPGAGSLLHLRGV